MKTSRTPTMGAGRPVPRDWARLLPQALCLALSLGCSAAGANADEEEVPGLLRGGFLGDATAFLEALPNTPPAAAERRQRMQALVVQRRAHAQALLALAEADLRQGRTLDAVARFDAAADLDWDLKHPCRPTSLTKIRERLSDVREAVAKCLERRDANCMSEAMRTAPAWAATDPVIVVMSLQAAAWWQPQGPYASQSMAHATGAR